MADTYILMLIEFSKNDKVTSAYYVGVDREPTHAD